MGGANTLACCYPAKLWHGAGCQQFALGPAFFHVSPGAPGRVTFAIRVDIRTCALAQSCELCVAKGNRPTAPHTFINLGTKHTSAFISSGELGAANAVGVGGTTNTEFPLMYGCVSNIARMPEHAQRELSALVVALDVYAFEFSSRSDTHWDASRRLVNWMAHQPRTHVG